MEMSHTAAFSRMSSSLLAVKRRRIFRSRGSAWEEWRKLHTPFQYMAQKVYSPKAEGSCQLVTLK